MFHAPVVIIADYAGTLEVGDTSEVRGRVTQQTAPAQAIPGQTPVPGAVAATQPATAPTYGLDLFTQPHLTARVLTRDGWEFDLTYAPTLTWEDVERVDHGICSNADCSALLLYETGHAAIAWHNETVRIALTEDASGGQYNSAAVPAQPPATMTPAGQVPPPMTTAPNQAATAPEAIWIGSSRTALEMQARLSRRSSLFLSVGYWISGGLNDASRIPAPGTFGVPLEYGPRADASFTYSLSRRDQLVTLAFAQDAQFSPEYCINYSALLATGISSVSLTDQCTSEDQVAQVSEGLRHALSRLTTVALDAGLTAARSRSPVVSSTAMPPTPPGGDFHGALFPNAHLGLAHHFGDRGQSSLLLDAALVPAIDFHTGILANRLQGSAVLIGAVSELVALKATVTGTQTVPTTDPLAISVVAGSGEVDCQVSRHTILSTGVRAWWQDQSGLGSFYSALIFLDLTVTAPPLRF